MSYRILITAQAEKQLKKLPKIELAKIDKHILELQYTPRPSGCKKLQGMDDVYRIRSGDYRVVYRIEDMQLIVEIIRVANRKEAYRK